MTSRPFLFFAFGWKAGGTLKSLLRFFVISGLVPMKGFCATTGETDLSVKCLQENLAQVCYTAGSSANDAHYAGRGDQSGLAEQLFRHGCELGSVQSCHGLASKLGLEGKIGEAISIASENCKRGYAFSCETAAYYLEKQGKIKDSLDFYRQGCVADTATFRGCREFGELVEKKEYEQLKSECAAKKRWACLAFGYAEKKRGNLPSAKSVFMQACEDEKSFFMACGVALSLIQAPEEVEKFVSAQALCAYWSGEEGYDQERRKQIEAGIQGSCRDRSAAFEVLRKKYRADREILFKIEQSMRMTQ